jgi:hypothetical protein
MINTPSTTNEKRIHEEKDRTVFSDVKVRKGAFSNLNIHKS